MKFLKKEELRRTLTRYDLTIRGTPSYVANGVVVHNCNARYVYHDGEYFCGSHKMWKFMDLSNTWWKILYHNENLQRFLRDNPDVVVFGEIYGQVQKGFNYGCAPGEVKFAAFDMFIGNSVQYVTQEWMDQAKMLDTCDRYDIPTAPMIASWHYDPQHIDVLLGLAEGKTAIPGADHIREGIVVGGKVTRYDSRTRFNKLKIVSNAYLCLK